MGTTASPGWTLTDQSLVQPMASPDAAPRFTMLETIREYAAETLSSGGERTAVERRHTDHYLAFAERAKELINGPDQALWLARLDAEQDNMRAVLERAVLDGDADTALRLGAALWRFWGQRGHLSEGGRLWSGRGIEGGVILPSGLEPFTIWGISPSTSWNLRRRQRTLRKVSLSRGASVTKTVSRAR